MGFSLLAKLLKYFYCKVFHEDYEEVVRLGFTLG